METDRVVSLVHVKLWNGGWKGLVVGLVAGAVLSSPAAAGTEPPAPPQPERDVEADPTSLIQIPVGCPTPDPAEVAFVGTVIAKDEFVEKGTVRYEIKQVRTGDAAQYSVDGIIDVRYGPDSQYLKIDEEYLASAAINPDNGVLFSKVSPDAPLFGGNDVVGLEDTEIECPVVDDPVQTINVDGTPVDSALLTPLFEDTRLLLSTLAVPAAIVGLALIALVLLRRGTDYGIKGIIALGRAAVVPTGDHRAARVRRHVTEREAAAMGIDVEDPPEDGAGTGTDAVESGASTSSADSDLVEA